jgi:DNA repair ATPase RecN
MTKGERGEIAMSRVQELTGAAKREDLAKLIAGDSWMGTMYGGAAIEKYITPIKDIIAKKTRLA